MQPQKRGRPATGKGTPVQVRLQPDLLAQLDSYIESDRPGMSRPEAIRLIVQMYLFLHNHPSDDELDKMDSDQD